MSRRGRITWIVALCLIVGLPLLTLAGVLIAGNTDAGRRYIERTTAHLSDGHVMLQGLSGRFPDRLHLSVLRLSDPQGAWLEARDIELDTRLAALLARRAQVQRFHVGDLSITRRPEYPPSPPADHRSHHSWLRNIRVDQLDLQRVALSAALTGNPTAFQIEGSADLHSIEQAQLQLSARRLDAVPCNYEAYAQIDRRQVSAVVDIQEAKGGAITQLAGVPDLGALGVHLRLQGPRDAVQTRIHLGAGPLTADISGSVNLDHFAAHLKVDAESTTIEPIFGVSWQQLSLHGEFQGTPSAPKANAQLRVLKLIVPGADSPSVDVTVHSEGDQVVADARVLGLNLASPKFVIPADKPVVLHAQAKLGDKAVPVDFTLANALINAQGHWKLATSEGTVSATLPNLKPLMAIGGLDLRGRGALEATFTQRGDTGQLQTRAELTVTGGASSVVSLLRPHTTAVATLLFRPAGLEFKDTRLTAGHAEVALDGTLLDKGMDVKYQASLPNLAAIAPQLAGKLKASGSIRGKSPSLDVDTEASGEISAHGTASGPLHLVVHAHDLPRHTNGSLTLTGALDGAPINVVAHATAAAGGSLMARIDHGDWKSAHLEGTVQTDADVKHASGKVSLRMTQLADLDRLLGQSLQGAIQADVVMDDAHGSDRAQVNLVAHDVGIPPQQVHDLQLRGHVDHPLTTPTLALELQANAQLNDRATHLTAQARGPLDKVEVTSRVNLDAVGDGEGAVDAAAQFEEAATLNVSDSSLRLTTLKADYRKANLYLMKPAVIHYGAGLSVDDLRLASGEARLTVAGQVSPTLGLHVDARHLSSEQLQVLSPTLAIAGQVNATADLSGDAARPTGHIELHAAGLRAGGDTASGLPASTVDLKVDLADAVAQVDLQAHAGQGLDFTAQGKVPMDQQAQLQLKANGAFDLNLLNPMLEAQGQQARGTLRINATLSGTGRAPEAHGTIVLAGVSIQDFARGARLTDIQATVNADGQTLSLQQFTAKAGPGTVTANGTIKLGNTDWPVDVKLSARDAQLLASDLVTANLDFDATLAGALRTQLTTGGTVKINRAVINIPSALPANLPTLHMIRPGERAAPPESSSGPVIAVDYRVSADHAVFVRGRGIDSEFRGQMHVQGNGDDIAISGGFEMVKGSIALGGTTLQFDRDSKLSFNGTGVHNQIDPSLDFSATNNTGTASSATLKVTGYADAPVLTLTSVPEMPQDQILSQLLFGTSNLSSLTVLQLGSIGSALVTLGGVGGGGGGFNPINTVQKKLGLDRLSIGSTGGSGSGVASQTPAGGSAPSATTIEAGRYVSSRVYVGAKESTEGTTQAEVQVDLTRRLKLTATLATGGGTVQGATPQNDPGSSAGVAYQLEY